MIPSLFRLRDTTLSSVARTSRRTRILWVPYLLRDITLDLRNIHSLYSLLERQPQLGQHIRSIRINRLSKDPTPEEAAAFNNLRNSLSQSPQLSQKEAQSEIIGFILSRSPNLQLLHLADGLFFFPLVETVGTCQRIPFNFLTSSLKRLRICPFIDLQSGMTAQNMIWILVFSPHLSQASLCFTIDRSSFLFLQDHVNTFRGLSHLKQLAIRPAIVWDYVSSEDAGWNQVPNGRKEELQGTGRDLETLAYSTFLQVTNNLDSLEIVGGSAYTRSGANVESKVGLEVISSLFNSFSSIKHLRLIAVWNKKEHAKMDLSVFKALKTLGLDSSSILWFEMGVVDEIPSTIEVLQLLFYVYRSSEPRGPNGYMKEESRISVLLNTPAFKNIREIYVPAQPIGASGSVIALPSQALKVWVEAGKELRENERVKSGIVKLKTWKLGEIGEFKLHFKLHSLVFFGPFPSLT